MYAKQNVQSRLRVPQDLTNYYFRSIYFPNYVSIFQIFFPLFGEKNIEKIDKLKKIITLITYIIIH